MQIEPPKGPRYTCAQSDFEGVPKLPTRLLMVAPSGSGKTVLLTSLILKAYRGCFARIYIFSPTVHLDKTWQVVKDYQKNTMKVSDREQTYFDNYSEAALQEIIDRQMAITELQKERGLTKLYQVLIILDDIADDPRIARTSKPVHELFVRGRHAMISSIVSVQKMRVVHPLVRVNATDLVVFRLRSTQDLDAVLEETSAVVGRKRLQELYDEATRDPYSFLYVRLATQPPEFWLRFERRLV
jgi:hypothetical protein